MSMDPVELERAVEELRKSALYIFRKKAKNALNRNDLVYEPSLELGWFDPPKGRIFFQNLQAAQVIRSEDGKEYQLNFDPESFSVPMDFKPDPRFILAELTEEVLADLEIQQSLERDVSGPAKQKPEQKPAEPLVSQPPAPEPEPQVKKEEQKPQKPPEPVKPVAENLKPEVTKDETVTPEPPVSAKPKSLFDQLVARLVEASGTSDGIVRQGVAAMEAQNPQLEPEVAALLYARKLELLDQGEVEQVQAVLVKKFRNE
jgi:hypothetical protein